MILFLPFIVLIFIIMLIDDPRNAVAILFLFLFAAFCFWIVFLISKYKKSQKDRKERALVEIKKSKILDQMRLYIEEIESILHDLKLINPNSNLYYEFFKLNSYILNLYKKILEKPYFDEADKDYFEKLKIKFEELKKHGDLKD